MKQCKLSCHRLEDAAMYFTDNEAQSDSTEKRSISLTINVEDEKVKEKKKGKITLGYLNIKFCLHICFNILFVVLIFFVFSILLCLFLNHLVFLNYFWYTLFFFSFKEMDFLFILSKSSYSAIPDLLFSFSFSFLVHLLKWSNMKSSVADSSFSGWLVENGKMFCDWSFHLMVLLKLY